MQAAIKESDGTRNPNEHAGHARRADSLRLLCHHWTHADPSDLREALTRKAPHKMDENLWRTREQLEEVLALCKDGSALAVSDVQCRAV